MRQARTPAEIRKIVTAIKGSGRTVGLVPTMGALHDGHASLVSRAVKTADSVIVSIFVNPTQFGPGEDLERYPRTPESDIKLLESLGCEVLFAPSSKDIYSRADRTRVSVRKLGDGLCGASRPGHFDGVALIVAKLLNIVDPDLAFFGQKDAQQAVIIQRMAADLDFPVRIKICETVREKDGLAMSSRNSYLTAEERKRAPHLYIGLVAAADAVRGGERDASRLEGLVRISMEEGGFDVEYARVVEGETLEPVEEVTGTVLIAAAGRLGNTRLIDNIALAVSGSDVRETALEFPGWSRYE